MFFTTIPVLNLLLLIGVPQTGDGSAQPGFEPFGRGSRVLPAAAASALSSLTEAVNMDLLTLAYMLLRAAANFADSILEGDADADDVERLN